MGCGKSPRKQCECHIFSSLNQSRGSASPPPCQDAQHMQGGWRAREATFWLARHSVASRSMRFPALSFRLSLPLHSQDSPFGPRPRVVLDTSSALQSSVRRRARRHNMRGISRPNPRFCDPDPSLRLQMSSPLLLPMLPSTSRGALLQAVCSSPECPPWSRTTCSRPTVARRRVMQRSLAWRHERIGHGVPWDTITDLYVVMWMQTYSE